MGKVLNTSILLFKSTKVNLFPEEMYKIFKYYVKNAQYNHLGHLLNIGHLIANGRLKKILMEYGHLSWIEKKLQVTKICNELQKL